MQIALGGLDPEGDRTRTYGSESTGVLGRAYYDYRNSNPTERNTGSSPGLGVFPAEMWLYQSYIHAQAYPSFQTQFASKFLAICPNMGGTPAVAGAFALGTTPKGEGVGTTKPKGEGAGATDGSGEKVGAPKGLGAKAGASVGAANGDAP